MTATRRLAAILAADVAGYSRLIGADESSTLQALKAIRAELIDPTIAAHNGRLVKTTGDGLLVEFCSVVDALRSATEIQAGMAERNILVPQDQRIEFRMGLNVGDVVVEDGDIFGDGVNVAARLEGLAEPGGIWVSARVQEDAAGRLDLAFEDMGEQWLKNIARPVRVYRVVTEARPETSRPGTDPPLPDKPSIAVLPFQNMSGDPEQEYFADGMVEEIITALSRIRWLFVIARNSSFTYKGQTVDVKRVGRELGVRYVLEGSVRKAGGRVRITAQLVDATTGAHLWADRFDGSLEDVFELQDKVASSVAGVIEPTLQAAEIRRSATRPTSDLTTYDLYLRAFSHFMIYDEERILQALDWLRQALARDPRYGPALALAANFRLHLDVNDWADDVEANGRTAINLARQALRGAVDEPDVLARAAFVLAYFGDDITACGLLIERALELNPSSAYAWLCDGWIRLWAGQPDAAIEHFHIYFRLNPRGLRGTVLAGIGLAHLFEQRHEEAVGAFHASLQLLPSLSTAYCGLASCYAHMGRLDDARATVERLGGITPLVTRIVMLFRNPRHRELFLSGLRLAAGEAT